MPKTAADSVLEAIAWVYEIPLMELHPQLQLFEFGADSVGLIVVADRVEADGWVISDSALKDSKTINDLIESAQWHTTSNQI